MAFDLSDYVPVSERVQRFYLAHPDGRIISSVPEIRTIGDRIFIEVSVSVYRSSDDPLPCVASAWEPFPGRSTFVKDSEMMNAETSAIGRAIAASGIGVSRSLASRDEVRNRQDEQKPSRAPQKPAGAPQRRSPAEDASREPVASEEEISDLVSRIAALPDTKRKETKDEFMKRFGKPADLAQSKIGAALDFVSSMEQG
jgi:hypothetical protein